MAINLKLSTRVNDDPSIAPWGRSWYGWDPDEPIDAVWENNRGCWYLGARADGERFATMSFEGTIRLVAEIHGRSEVYYNGGCKPNLALEGELLPVGHPVLEALIGREVDHHRNPMTYVDTGALEGEYPRGEPDDHFFVAALANLSLTPEEMQAVWDVTGRGGQHVVALRVNGDDFVDLRPDDVVFIVDDAVADTPIVAVAYAVGPERMEPSQHPPTHGAPLKISIEAIVDVADALFWVDPETEEPVDLRNGAGPIDRDLGEEVFELWHDHLVAVGWWGDLKQTVSLMNSYAAHFRSSEEPAPVAVTEDSRADSEDAFLALARAHDGPDILSMARTYLTQMGLGAGQFSISALPKTGRSKAYRRAITLSIGGTEALWIGIEPPTGRILDWGVRVTPTYDQHKRWLNVDVQAFDHGHYAMGGGSLPFLRLFSEDYDVNSMRRAARELTSKTKAAQRKGWHNPYLETAVLEPPTS